MKAVQRLTVGAAAAAVLFGLSGCGGMSTRDQYTAGGAAAGAVAGGLLSGGNTAATVGGAAVGGLIGNQVGKDK